MRLPLQRSERRYAKVSLSCPEGHCTSQGEDELGEVANGKDVQTADGQLNRRTNTRSSGKGGYRRIWP